MKEFIIDRFEGDFAVLENEFGDMNSVLRTLIESQAKEGERVYFNGELYCVDKTHGAVEKERIRNKFEKLKKK